MKSRDFAKYSCAVVLALSAGAGIALGQSQERPASGAAGAPAAATTGVTTAPPGYLIGADDILQIVYWREKELSAEAVVRPDGMISLPLLNDIRAAGLTPEQLRSELTAAASKFVEDPTVTVVVKAINSRKVFVTGQVSKPGPYQLNGYTTVMQLIATAGGLAEYANKSKIIVLRTEAGKSLALPFNYEEVTAGKRLQQNVELRPGDTVVVP